jgi:hypothetical protein
LVLVFPCCEVGAAVAVGPMAMMPCGGQSCHDGFLRRESCISLLRSSLSESELPVSCAKSLLFGIGRRGLHEAVAARSSLVVVLGEVRVAGSWRSDDDDTDRQPR